MSSIIVNVLNDSLAQLVEHLTLNQQVRGSIPRWVTICKSASQLNATLFYFYKKYIKGAIFYGKITFYWTILFYNDFPYFYFSIYGKSKHLYCQCSFTDEFLMGVGVVSKVMFVRKFYKPLIAITIIGIALFAITYK